ncbi:uncharacterized protein G2W53_024505 [Senna tora]|uniref:Uncharacterized protein n=1 Tax=Senna tora TaxID=362788 RepID=A0A834WD66_9FABA|nr:uncharacterized protein G2W53_024505 [Senna tora]
MALSEEWLKEIGREIKDIPGVLGDAASNG